jgi:hypothetical protein
MAEVPEHPITTPKGATAVTILLGVVSVFAPFLFYLRAALLFGAVAILVIGWTYLAEARLALANRSWNPHLNVPLGAVTVIVLMGIISARNVADAPKPVVVPNADDVAQRVAALMEKHQPKIALAAPKEASPVVVTPTKLHEPVPTPISRKTRIIAAISHASLAEKTEEPSRSSSTLASVLRCAGNVGTVSGTLYRLAEDAGNYQNGWAYSRDGEQLREQYQTWMGAVRQAFSDHSDLIKDTREFDQVKELDMGRPLFLIPNSGLNAWHNFDERRKALMKMAAAIDKTDCTNATDPGPFDIH